MNLYYAGTILNTSVLLSTAALGAQASITADQLNLGGEGQIYAGGFTAAVILVLTKSLPPFVSLLLACFAAAAVSCILALISAALKALKNADVLLTSFLVSAAVIPFIDSLIAGRFRGTTGNLLATPLIPKAVQLTKIMPPSPLNISVFTVPVICTVAWFLLYKTVKGKQLRISGIAPEFSLYCGYNRTAQIAVALAVSGALHGIAGFLAVSGTYYTCHSGFYSGMGWNALSCALIAGSQPFALIPSSLAVSALFTESDRIALTSGSDMDLSSLIQGIVLFAVAVKYSAGRRQK